MMNCFTFQLYLSSSLNAVKLILKFMAIVIANHVTEVLTPNPILARCDAPMVNSKLSDLEINVESFAWVVAILELTM